MYIDIKVRVGYAISKFSDSLIHANKNFQEKYRLYAQWLYPQVCSKGNLPSQCAQLSTKSLHAHLKRLSTLLFLNRAQNVYKVGVMPCLQRDTCTHSKCRRQTPGRVGLKTCMDLVDSNSSFSYNPSKCREVRGLFWEQRRHLRPWVGLNLAEVREWGTGNYRLWLYQYWSFHTLLCGVCVNVSTCAHVFLSRSLDQVPNQTLSFIIVAVVMSPHSSRTVP